MSGHRETVEASCTPSIAGGSRVHFAFCSTFLPRHLLKPPFALSRISPTSISWHRTSFYKRPRPEVKPLGAQSGPRPSVDTFPAAADNKNTTLFQCQGSLREVNCSAADCG